MTGIPKEHVNSVLAMLTAAIHTTEGGSVNDPHTLQAIAKTINEVPKDELAMICAHAVNLTLRQLARKEGKSVEDMWRIITLAYAESWPDDQPGTDSGR